MAKLLLEETQGLFYSVLNGYEKQLVLKDAESKRLHAEFLEAQGHTTESSTQLTNALLKVEELNADIKRLETKVAEGAKAAEANAELSTKLSTLEAENAALRKELMTNSKELVSTRERCEVEVKARDAALQRVIKVEEELAARQADAVKAAGALGEELERIKKDLAAMTARAVRAETDASATHESLNAAAVERTEMEARFKSLEDQVTALGAGMEQATSLLAKEQSSWKSRNAVLEKKLETEHANVARLTEELAAAVEGGDAALQSARARASELEKACNDTEAELQAAKVEEESMRRKLKKEGARLYNLEEEMERMVSRSQMEAAVREQISQRQSLEQMVRELEAQLAAVSGDLKKVGRDAERQRRATGNSVDELESLLNTAEARAIAAEKARDKAVRKAQEACDNLVDVTRERDSYKAHVDKVTEGFQVAKTISKIRGTEVKGASREVGFDALLSTVDSVVRTVDSMGQNKPKSNSALIGSVRKGK